MSYVYDRRVGTQSAGYPRLGSTNPAVPVLLSMGVNEPLSKVFTCLNEFKDMIPAITCYRLYVDRPARLLIRPTWSQKSLYTRAEWYAFHYMKSRSFSTPYAVYSTNSPNHGHVHEPSSTN